MPNWVENTVSITAEADVIKEIRARLEKDLEQGFFWQIIAPTDLEAYNGTGWYDWNLNHWGCKWDASELNVGTPSDEEVVYTFNTPWSPPIVISALAEIYPSAGICHAYLEEQGWGGVVTYKNGEVIHEETWDIPETHADSMKYTGYCYGCDDEDYRFDDCPKEEVSA
jgi:Ferredoxin-like domain in Api92-like protein